MTTDRMAMCPVCASNGLVEKWESQNFFVDDDTEVSVFVPVLHCSSCEFSFTDQRAEETRHSALCRHEGLLNHEQIQAIRTSYGMTRKEFADEFCFGEASLERWENRRVLQNKQADRYLRLLADRAIGLRVIRMNKELRQDALKRMVSGEVVNLDKFRSLRNVEALRIKAEQFRMCREAS